MREIVEYLVQSASFVGIIGILMAIFLLAARLAVGSTP